MPLLKNLLAGAVRKVAADPRVREAAKQILEEKVKPSAEAAWDRAKPEIEKTIKRAKPKVEEAWKRAKPQVAQATRKASKEATAFAGRLKEEVRQRAAMRDADRSDD